MYVILFKAFSVWRVYIKNKDEWFFKTKAQADKRFKELVAAANGKVEYKMAKMIEEK